MSSSTCEIPAAVVDTFRTMKMSKSKTNNALLLKINAKTLEVELDEQLDNFTWPQLQDALPESTPRYLALSYAWNMGDDRVSYPLVFIYYAPECSSKINMLYASTKASPADVTVGVPWR